MYKRQNQPFVLAYGWLIVEFC